MDNLKIKNGYKLGLFGSRTLTGKKISDIINKEIDKYDIKEIVTAGEIEGVSKEGRIIAKKRAIILKLFFPNTKRFAAGCYHMRSKFIINHADKFLLIWDGKSKGTKNEIDLLNKYGYKYNLVKVKPKRSSEFDVSMLPDFTEELV